jgi:hypothetical protein
MKKSVRDKLNNKPSAQEQRRIDENARRQQIVDEEANIARSAQRQIDERVAQAKSSRVIDAVGAPGTRFPLGSDTKVPETDRADMEIRMGLQLHNNPSTPVDAFVSSLLEREFEWDEFSDRAARFAAEGMPPTLICQNLNLSPHVFETWLANTEFRLKIRSYLEGLSEHVMMSGLANRAHRLIAANDRWAAQKTIVAQRAKRAKADPELEKIPGATTGWVTDKGEYDAALAKEMRDTEKHGAIEVGQWNEGGAPASKIEIVYADKQLIINHNENQQ